MTAKNRMEMFVRLKQTVVPFMIVLLLCTGCAQQKTVARVHESNVEQQGDEMDMLLSDDFYDDESVLEEEYYDPLEPMNRIFFEFNDKLYYWVLDPMNSFYTGVLPLDIRHLIGNFFKNIAAPIRLVNNVLQWKINDAGVVLSRFLINSTLGVYGLGDPALNEFGLEPKPEDFGQTLGSWGVGEGVYLCWPILGPSTLRDSIGFVADVYSHPMGYFIDDYLLSGEYYFVNRLNLLSLNPGVYEDFKKYSLDPYVSMRQAYLDYRRNKVDDIELKQKLNENL